MGFGFTVRKSNNKVKLIRKHVKERMKETQIINGQLKRLAAQLENKSIYKCPYTWLRDVLEINSVKQG
jgi:hypothetical protein